MNSENSCRPGRGNHLLDISQKRMHGVARGTLRARVRR